MTQSGRARSLKAASPAGPSRAVPHASRSTGRQIEIASFPQATGVNA